MLFLEQPQSARPKYTKLLHRMTCHLPCREDLTRQRFPCHFEIPVKSFVTSKIQDPRSVAHWVIRNVESLGFMTASSELWEFRSERISYTLNQPLPWTVRLSTGFLKPVIWMIFEGIQARMLIQRQLLHTTLHLPQPRFKFSTLAHFKMTKYVFLFCICASSFTSMQEVCKAPIFKKSLSIKITRGPFLKPDGGFWNVY